MLRTGRIMLRRARSCCVGAGLCGVGASAGEGPGEGAWLGLFEVPAGCLLGAVVASAERGAVAFARPPALVVGNGVVVVASAGRSPAAGERAGAVPGFEQVPQGWCW